MKKITTTLLLLTAIACLHGQDMRGNLEKHVYTLAADSMMGRRWGGEYIGKSADYILDRMVGSEIMASKVSWGGSGVNVMGIIPGNDPDLAEEYIVIGAHYDHLGVRRDKDGGTTVYNGADDNASGVAAMLEAGRVLSRDRALLKRSVILVAFDGEEQGLLGSAAFVENPPVPLEKIKLMLNLDMVGWYGESGKLTYVGAGMIKDGDRLSEILSSDFISVEYKPFDTAVMTDSDHSSFAKKGIPAMYITTGTKSPYHKPEDDPELIDYDGLVNVTGHLTVTAKYFAAQREVEPSGEVARKHRGRSAFETGLTAGLGHNRLHFTEGPVTGKPKFSYNVGLYSRIRLAGNFYLRPGVDWEHLAAKYPGGKFHTDNISVPVSLMVLSSDAAVGVYAAVGGYYSYTLSGKAGGEKMDFGHINRHRGGITCGVGLLTGGIGMGVVWKDDLTNMFRRKHPDGYNIENRGVYFTMDFRF